MAVQVFSEADQLSSSGIEHSLIASGASGVYVLEVDRKNQLAGQTLELRAKVVTRTEGDGSEMGTLLYKSWADEPVEGDPDRTRKVQLGPFSALYGFEVSLQCDDVAVFPWNVQRVG